MQIHPKLNRNWYFSYVTTKLLCKKKAADDRHQHLWYFPLPPTLISLFAFTSTHQHTVNMVPAFIVHPSPSSIHAPSITSQLIVMTFEGRNSLEISASTSERTRQHAGMAWSSLEHSEPTRSLLYHQPTTYYTSHLTELLTHHSCWDLV
jgi:hypothetical protein